MDTNANTTIAARCSVYGRGWASAGSISQTLTPGAVSSDAFWRASIPPGRCRVGVSRRELRALRGFVFDLDGCVWTGDVLVPGAAEVLAMLREQGRRVSFLTNNSSARSAAIQVKLERLGVQAAKDEVLTPLEILSEVIASRWGLSRGPPLGGGGLSPPGSPGRGDCEPLGPLPRARHRRGGPGQRAPRGGARAPADGSLSRPPRPGGGARPRPLPP